RLIEEPENSGSECPPRDDRDEVECHLDQGDDSVVIVSEHPEVDREHQEGNRPPQNDPGAIDQSVAGHPLEWRASPGSQRIVALSMLSSRHTPMIRRLWQVRLASRGQPHNLTEGLTWCAS